MSLSLAQRLKYASVEERAIFVKRLTPEQATEIAAGIEPWWLYRRPEQAQPAGCRRWWLICAGRGWGKTRTGAEWLVQKARDHPGARCALIATTFTDGRDTMVEGESGLLSVLRPHELRGGTVETAWNRSLGELFMANGSRFKIFSSEKPRQLRGPQFHYAWGDEPAYWDDAARGAARDSTFTNANFALRLPPRKEWPDNGNWKGEGVLTTTPRAVPLMKVPDEVLKQNSKLAGLMQRDDVTMTRGRTLDNIDNLSDEYREAVIDPLIGTTLGLQELDAEILEDVDGALWTTDLIAAGRVEETPELARVVVTLDPAGGGGIGHDEHGVIVAGSAGVRGESDFYVIADLSANCTVTEAARRAILAYIEYQADAIVFEKNQGQDWVRTTIQSTFDEMVRTGEIERFPLSIQDVTAGRSKTLRAQPVAGLYEQGTTRDAGGTLHGVGRVHHVGLLSVLEGQMTSWVQGDSDSPDRLDALVYAILWLYGEGPSRADVASPAHRERRGRRPGMPSSRLPAVYGTRGRSR